ncbi:MAG: response regulator transcription factor [Deltaproteobacteria bacterium]|uniref:Response regulator transcription factor n=1 Tax=Candidatus Desulfacyla euxinica TaxID=2841693 RepID=A0A8J6N165_9DELT|nr:response regulator transcription factor [Candidatus Desulfacyla euxinica]
MKSYHILLADDHVMFRQGIKKIIEESNNLKIVGEVGNGLELLEFLKNHPVDMVILDISMPDMRGIEATREAKIIRPDIKVLILTMHKNTEYLQHSIKAGADGYLIKEESDTELVTAINKVLQGDRYISHALSLELADDFLRKGRKDFKQPFDGLTIREREVLKLIAEGKSSRGIAELLFISPRTAEHHRANIRKKLNLQSTADLTKHAIKMGYTGINS